MQKLNKNWVLSGAMIGSMGIAALTLLLSQACTPADQQASRADAQEPPHAVHSEELKSAMADLNRTSREDIAAEIYSGTPSQEQTAQLAEAADAIAKAAGKLPRLVERQSMTPADHEAFSRIAAQLGESARHVSSAAKSGNLAAARSAIKRMNASCTACHSQFRIPGV